MATTTKKKNTKKTGTTKKTTKKTEVTKQIEQLEEALKTADETNAIDLLPEEVKTEIKAEEAKTPLDNPEEIDFDKEVEKVLSNTEPSEEVKAQVEKFEAEKEKLNKEIEKNPENAEKLISDELKQIQELKKKIETMRSNLRNTNRERSNRENFTNLWNGIGYDL